MSCETAVSCNFSISGFWDSINITITRPHLFNKRLWGAKILYVQKTETNWECLNEALVNYKFTNTSNFNNFLNKFKKSCSKISSDIKYFELEVYLVELLPKKYEDDHAFQVVILDKSNTNVTFTDITPESHSQKLCPNFSYSFCLNGSKITLEMKGGDIKMQQWLKETVMAYFVKWNEECETSEPRFCNGSLNLVDIGDYYEKYNQLKVKYGKELVKIWPECTDPAKFVYEDIAIATYLLLLWADTRSQPMRFLDIGCGNGLLVYILTMEGHSGIGVDVRKRKIWDMYPENVKLVEKTVTPTNIDSFSETDWIIGNHSDEMTPWIPIIAVRNAYKCNFFLLPCCAFNIDGSKYQRQNSAKSQYMEYLEHIKRLCESFGYQTLVDRLKIPSTKRICLIGKMKSYTEQEHLKYYRQVSDVIKKELQSSASLNNGDMDFKTRETVERVRNCTQVDKSVIDTIITCVTNFLLTDINSECSWSAGREVAIQDLIKLIPKDMLQMLKSECGGLQTLLKNNHHIFKVLGGKVALRYPKSIDEVHENMKKRQLNNVKTCVKPCWFYSNHPQGCPLNDNNCSYLHQKAF